MSLAPIETDRLRLVPFPADFIRASLTRRLEDAERLIGCVLPEDWANDSRSLLELRLSQIERDPEIVEWLLRGIVLKESDRLVGHIGFHDRPGNPEIESVAPGAVEMGFTMEPGFRRRGMASESVTALMEWALRSKGVNRFLTSVRPDNTASLALIAKLGFRKISHHVDPVDGHEDIFEKNLIQR